MPERGPNPNRVSLAADTVILGTTASGLIAELINYRKPHSLDSVSGHIENHMGNFPPSFLFGLACMKLSRILLYKAFKEEAVQKKMEPIIPVASMFMVVGLNVVVESLKTPNPEFGGDVVSGIIGGTLGIAHAWLPDRLETHIVRKVKRLRQKSKD